MSQKTLLHKQKNTTKTVFFIFMLIVPQTVYSQFIISWIQNFQKPIITKKDIFSALQIGDLETVKKGIEQDRSSFDQTLKHKLLYSTLQYASIEIEKYLIQDENFGINPKRSSNIIGLLKETISRSDTEMLKLFFKILDKNIIDKPNHYLGTNLLMHAIEHRKNRKEIVQ